jgi:hypothetical protein
MWPDEAEPGGGPGPAPAEALAQGWDVAWQDVVAWMSVDLEEHRRPGWITGGSAYLRNAIDGPHEG